MAKNKNYLTLIFSISLIVFVLWSTVKADITLADADANTFTITNSNVFSHRATIQDQVVNEAFNIYVYATVGGSPQSPAVLEPIPLTVTVIAPNNSPYATYNIEIPIGGPGTSGKLEGLKCPSSGTWKIEVSGYLKKNGKLTTVTEPFKVTVNPLNVTPSEATISLGTTQKYEALFTNSQGNQSIIPDNQVEWLSSDESVATISSTGVATSVGLGICEITAKYSTYKKTSQLTVVLPTLRINPESKTIKLGSNQLYQATFEDLEGNSIDSLGAIVWSSNSSGVATIDSSSGLATSKGIGTCTITATYQVNGESISATATLMVVNFSITPIFKTVYLGDTQQYIAVFTNSDGVVNEVTSPIVWSSFSYGFGEATINGNGLATAKREGSSTILATYTVNGVAIKASANLSILKPNLSINPNSAMVLMGAPQQYQAILTHFNGHTENVTQEVTWESDQTSVATINASGLAIGLEVGTCTIIGTYVIHGVSIPATSILEVVNFRITPANKTISLGSTQQYGAEFTDSTGTISIVSGLESVTWSSSNTGVATIGTAGLTTAKGIGSSTISATYTINEANLSATALLTIQQPLLRIIPTSSTILPGSTIQYQALLTDSEGNTLEEVTQSVVWSSDQPNVATIDSFIKGLVTGKVTGTCVISGTYTLSGINISATATLEIRNLSLAESLIVTPVPLVNAIFIGDTQQFSAQLRYIDGTISDVSNFVAWSSSASPVATIDNTGLVTGISAGTSLITATFNINNNPITGAYQLTVLPLNGGIIRAWEQ